MITIVTNEELVIICLFLCLFYQCYLIYNSPYCSLNLSYNSYNWIFRENIIYDNIYEFRSRIKIGKGYLENSKIINTLTIRLLLKTFYIPIFILVINDYFYLLVGLILFLINLYLEIVTFKILIKSQDKNERVPDITKGQYYLLLVRTLLNYITVIIFLLS